MLLLISLVFVMLDCLLGAPTGREVYRMPQSALKGIFKHFSFQFGLFTHPTVVRVLAGNTVFLQMENMCAFRGEGDQQIETTSGAFKLFLFNRSFSLLSSPQCFAEYCRLTRVNYYKHFL